MYKMILKQLWNERKGNLFIWLEMLVVSIFLWYAADALFVMYRLYSQPLGFNIEHTYHVSFGVISTVQQADGTIGYADASQAGDLGTVAVKVGDDYVPFSAEAAAKVVDASPLDDSAKGDNRVVVKLDHNTTEKGAYPIVLVSYDVACPAYKDANTAKFVKSWLTYVTSDEGQQTAASAAGSAPMSNTLRQKVVKSIDTIKTK